MTLKAEAKHTSWQEHFGTPGKLSRTLTWLPSDEGAEEALSLTPEFWWALPAPESHDFSR